MSINVGLKTVGHRMETFHRFAIYFVMTTTFSVALYHSYRQTIKEDLVPEMDDINTKRQERRDEYLLNQLDWLSKPRDPRIPKLHQESSSENENK